ncbi:MAG: ORC1-type DNA replication protein, partial [Nanoarchaeota archaeon]|nr:ORC1-type DNA replication protein [Nanoarchaeota archaeon]
NFFETFLNKGPIFENKKALQASYTPEQIFHRDDQIKQIAGILAPMLRMEKPSNLFMYGKTGTGKTLGIKYVIDQMRQVASQQEIPLTFIYLNCKLKKVADTEYRLMSQLSREFGKAIPPTGLPTDEIYKIFFDAIDKKEQLIILILDEIDQLVKKAGDGILYNLTRINSELKNSQICLVGISNDLMFTDALDPRVKSSLSEEEVLFPPYNALQIQDILKGRASVAFKEGVLEPGIVEKCAAYAAREHGDARRALELLRVAGELAERTQSNTVMIKHLDSAEEKIERDRVVDIVMTQPKQFQAVMYAILGSGKTSLTGDVYELYKDVCAKSGLRPLTQRRVSDVIAELDMLGMVSARVISKGRYGRTREISLSIPNSIHPKVQTILREGLGL